MKFHAFTGFYYVDIQACEVKHALLSPGSMFHGRYAEIVQKGKAEGCETSREGMYLSQYPFGKQMITGIVKG